VVDPIPLRPSTDDGDSGGVPDLELVPGSEDAMAAEFASLYRHLYRHTAGMGWMRCMPECWVRDDHLTAFDCARQIARIAASEEASIKVQRAICSARTINAILTIARSEPQLVLPADQWDADPFDFNTPAGVVDLRTGKLKPRGDEEYFTKCTAVRPAFKAPCPTWDRFLLDVFLGDRAMVDFVQRMIGYLLTGDRREQKIFFLQGGGANGKSTLVDFIGRLVGSYAIKLPAHVLMHNPMQAHPTELAQLRGKRLAISSEIEEGQHWAESRIKELTGDETLTARFMRQDFFEFRQSQKHLVVGNHKPRLRGGDAAIARRFVLVPFLAKFSGAKRDQRMLERLQAEAPAVLAWAIQGAIKWQAEGLAIPSSVAAASQAYMEENDDLAAWIEENCVLGPDTKGKASVLYANYLGWLKVRGQHAPSMKTWGDRMSVVAGVAKSKSNGSMVYSGVGLRADGLFEGEQT
jgi:putative DNA primase/helicase